VYTCSLCPFWKGTVAIASALLTPEALKGPLRSCGYRRDLLRSNVRFGDAGRVPLVGFAQLPTDARSACVAVLPETSEPRQAVEACKPVGAPVYFVCHGDTLQWWKQGTTSAEWLESIPAKRIDGFFRAHQDAFSPEAIYRAKTLGRVRSEYQLAFVDLGLMPLVEEEVGTALSNLIARNVSGLKKRLGWVDVTSKQGHWLLQSIFWLVSAKILRDKDVPSFEDIDLEDVEDVFVRVAGHYGSEPLRVGGKRNRESLGESARIIERFSSLAVTTTESLAYVYENTLISKQTRSQLGTHSTPSYLVDYVLGHLSDWIEEIPENERSVFEPACGHAAFLVSAMRLLTQLLPAEKAISSRRGPYLRRRLHGTDIDAFALELARLSLTLTDIPNPDGWDLRVEDMFVGNRLEEQTQGNTILLANPPFANFKPEERAKYAEQGVEIRFMNRAAEMLWRTVPSLSPDSVFGVVVPQTFLHASNAADVRRFLVEHCELREIRLFPDGVFSFSDAESAVLLGRKLPPKSRRGLKTRYCHVRETQLPAFRAGFDTSRTEIVPQSQFRESADYSLRVPDLAEVWTLLGGTVLDSVADVGQGLIYHGKHLPNDAVTYSENRFAGAKRGFVHFDSGLRLSELPRLHWMNLAGDVIRRPMHGTTTDVPQVLLNYAPVSRSPWRLKALSDRTGRPVTSRFIAIRPRHANWSLEVLWALLNSPVANAYAFTHMSKRDNPVGAVRQLPVPNTGSVEAVEGAAKAYLDAARHEASSERLQELLLQVDVEVLKLYSLPVEMERALLDLFNGWERVGVPFTQTRYFPPELEHPIRLSDFVDYEADWSRTNRRRGRLIDKKIKKSLSDSERTELDALQAYADYHIQKVAPRPTRVLDELEDLLFAKSNEQNKDT